MILNYDYKNENGEYAPYILVLDDKQVINPTAEQYSAAGYFPVQVEQPHTDYLPDTNEFSEPLEVEEDGNVEVEQQIEEFKQRLADTDYKAIKFAEGWISDEDYATIKAKRQGWRD